MIVAAGEIDSFCAPAGTVVLATGPTATILPSRTTMAARSITWPRPSMTRALTKGGGLRRRRTHDGQRDAASARPGTIACARMEIMRGSVALQLL